MFRKENIFNQLSGMQCSSIFYSSVIVKPKTCNFDFIWQLVNTFCREDRYLSITTTFYAFCFVFVSFRTYSCWLSLRWCLATVLFSFFIFCLAWNLRYSCWCWMKLVEVAALNRLIYDWIVLHVCIIGWSVVLRFQSS